MRLQHLHLLVGSLSSEGVKLVVREFLAQEWMADNGLISTIRQLTTHAIVGNQVTFSPSPSPSL